MNLPSVPSISAALGGTGATGTLSAKPAAMIGNALPFRFQLEASTAPLATVAAAPQDAAGFVLPDAIGDELDLATMGKDGSSEPSEDELQDRDAEDAAIPVLPLIFDLPHYTAQTVGAPLAASADSGSRNGFVAELTGTVPQSQIASATRSDAAASMQLGTETGAVKAEVEVPASDLQPTAAVIKGAARATSQPDLATGPQAARPDADTPSTKQSLAAPAETAIADAATPAVQQSVAPSIERAFLQRGANAVPGASTRFETSVKGSSESNMRARVGALPMEADSPASDDLAAMSRAARSATTTSATTTSTAATTSLPLQPADPALSQMQDAAGAPIQQAPAPAPSQPGPAHAPTPFASATPIPFDRQFGQRVGSAIGSAMNAMSVKDGMLLLQITPERLGKIEIMIDPGSDRLQITTENEAVRGAIAQAHGRIEQELRAAGHRMSSIDVETREPASGQTGQQQAGAQQQQRGEQAPQHALGQRSASRALPQDRSAELSPSVPNPTARPSSNIFYA